MGFAVVAFAGRTHVLPADWLLPGCSGHTANSSALAGEGEVTYCCCATTSLFRPMCRNGQLHNLLYFLLTTSGHKQLHHGSFRNSKLRTEGEQYSTASTVLFILRTSKYIQSFNGKVRELPNQKDSGQLGTSQETENPPCSHLCL